MSAGNGRKARGVCERLQSARGALVERLKGLEAEERALSRLGCWDGRGPYYKASRAGGPKNKMFIYRMESGSREYQHIGTDPKDQEAAQIKMRRFSAREHLRALVAQLRQRIQHFDAGMDELLIAVENDVHWAGERWDDYQAQWRSVRGGDGKRKT